MPRPKITEPSKNHIEIMKAIQSIERQGEVATVQNVALQAGYAGTSSITDSLRVMQRLELLDIIGGGTRGRRRIIRIRNKGYELLSKRSLPVLGSISAGLPSDAIEIDNDRIALDEIFGLKLGDFLLRVQGDSLIGDAILPGDLVLIRPSTPKRNGDIVAVQLDQDGTTTLKHLIADHSTNIVTLRASNPIYEDIVLPMKDVKILGHIVGILRQTRG
jgi:repressor LexA